MKYFLFFLIVFSQNVAGSIGLCSEIPRDQVIESDILIKSHEADIGFHYILSTPKIFRGIEFNSAAVEELDGDNIRLLFFPHMKGEGDVLSSVMISEKKLVNATLSVSYGDTCNGGLGYRVIYNFSPLEAEDY